MIETITEKLNKKASGTDKEFLLELIKKADSAKRELLTFKHPKSARTDVNDLRRSLENVIVLSAIIIFTGRDGVCELKDEEILMLNS